MLLSIALRFLMGKIKGFYSQAPVPSSSNLHSTSVTRSPHLRSSHMGDNPMLMLLAVGACVHRLVSCTWALFPSTSPPSGKPCRDMTNWGGAGGGRWALVRDKVCKHKTDT